MPGHEEERVRALQRGAHLLRVAVADAAAAPRRRAARGARPDHGRRAAARARPRRVGRRPGRPTTPVAPVTAIRSSSAMPSSYHERTGAPPVGALREVETVGIEPTSAIARRATSTSVSGALDLALASPHRQGPRGPVRLNFPPFGADGPPGGDPASDSAGSRRGLRERRLHYLVSAKQRDGNCACSHLWCCRGFTRPPAPRLATAPANRPRRSRVVPRSAAYCTADADFRRGRDRRRAGRRGGRREARGRAAWRWRSSRTASSAASARSGPACPPRRCCAPTRRWRRRAGFPARRRPSPASSTCRRCSPAATRSSTTSTTRCSCPGSRTRASRWCAAAAA